jgi:hypothetical protein
MMSFYLPLLLFLSAAISNAVTAWKLQGSRQHGPRQAVQNFQSDGLRTSTGAKKGPSATGDAPTEPTEYHRRLFSYTSSKESRFQLGSPSVTLGRNQLHTGQSPFVGCLTGALMSPYPAAGYGAFYSTPTIGNNGSIYFGSDDKNVYAINLLTNTQEWYFDSASDYVRSAPGAFCIVVCTCRASLDCTNVKNIERWIGS